MKLTSQAYYIKLSLLSLFNYIIILFNITKLTWQDGLRKTDVAYFSMELVTQKKGFNSIVTWVQCYKTFLSTIYNFFNKLECLSLAGLFRLVLCLWVRLEPTSSTFQVLQSRVGHWPCSLTLE